jgi:hypothetical protein
MKRLLLVGLLGGAVLAVAPVASATAAEGVKCKFAGTAKFSPPLSPVPSVGFTTYEFESEPEKGANECEGTTAKKAEASSAKVKGKGHLSCTLSPGLGVAGLAVFESGGLKAGSREEFTLTKFEFVGVGPVVGLTAEGSNKTEEFKGGGEANFLEAPGALLECASGKLSSVVFKATTAGVLK